MIEMAVRRPLVRRKQVTLSPIQRALKSLTSAARRRGRVGKKVTGRKTPRRRIVQPKRRRIKVPKISV
jgi:hypothetical protein